MFYVVTVLVFATVALLIWAVLSTFFSPERAVSKRLENLSSYESGEAAAAHRQLRPFGERVLTPSRERARETITGLTPSATRDRIRQRLLVAGNPAGMDVGRFLGLKAASVIGVTALALAFAVVTRASVMSWLLVIIVSVASYWFPDLWLSTIVAKRQKEIRIALPDMLDMLTISVEAGLGFDQAIAKIVKMTHGPLAREFARMLQEIQAGSDRSEALKRLTARNEVPELNAFVTAIVQAEQLGIPIANVLRIQAKEMRLTRRQRAEEQGLKTPVKIVFPLILCILPATMIVIIGPAAVNIAKALL